MTMRRSEGSLVELGWLLPPRALGPHNTVLLRAEPSHLMPALEPWPSMRHALGLVRLLPPHTHIPKLTD